MSTSRSRIANLGAVRRRGYALNNQQTETGLTAIGIALNHPDSGTVAAVCLAMPTGRYHRDRIASQVAELAATVDLIRDELVATEPR